VAPGCPASVPGGLQAWELRALVGVAADAGVRSADIVEVDAAADAADGRTVRLAALCVLELLAGLHRRKVTHDDARPRPTRQERLGRSRLDDHDRPLNARGLRDAPVLAGGSPRRGLQLDAVLSSTALRARTTASFFAGVRARARADPDLYGAPAGTLLAAAAARACPP
jgi:hypothetical protein